MADNLGEVFVEIVADTSGFAASLEEGVGGAVASVGREVGEAFEDVGNEIERTFGEIGGVADEAFADVGEVAAEAAGEVVEAFEEGAGQAQEALEGITMDAIADGIRDNIGKITLAFAAKGTAVEAFARTQGETNAVIGRVGAVSGESEESLRDLILGMTDATFSAEDAAAGMERLVRSGVSTAEEFETILPVMDTFADATGKDVVESIDLFDRVLSALDVPLTEAEEHMDALGFIATQTTVPLDNLGMLMRREAQNLREYGMSTDDVAVAMAALEAEGIRGPRAVMAFQQALEAGEGDMAAFHRELGVGADTLEEQRRRLADSAGMVDQFADINNAAMTPVQRLQANIQNQMFRFGGLTEAAGMASGALAAVGPTMAAITHGAGALTVVKGALVKSMGVLAKATGPLLKGMLGLGKGFLALGKVILANPLFLIGALLVGIAVLIWKFRDEIIEALVGAWEWIKDKVGAVFDWFRDAISGVITWVKDNWTTILAIITGPIGLAIKFIVDNWDRLRQTFTRIVTRIVDAARNAFTRLRDTVTGAITSLRDSVTERLNAIVSFVVDLPARVVRGLGNLGRLLFDQGRAMIQGLLDGATSLLRNIGKFFLDRIPGWIRSPFEKALGISSPSRVFAEIGRDTVAGFAEGVSGEFRGVTRLMDDLADRATLRLDTSALADADIAPGQLGADGARRPDVTVTVVNPVPEPASTSVSREMRKLAFTGVFGD